MDLTPSLWETPRPQWVQLRSWASEGGSAGAAAASPKSSWWDQVSQHPRGKHRVCLGLSVKHILPRCHHPSAHHFLRRFWASNSPPHTVQLEETSETQPGPLLTTAIYHGPNKCPLELEKMTLCFMCRKTHSKWFKGNLFLVFEIHTLCKRK